MLPHAENVGDCTDGFSAARAFFFPSNRTYVCSTHLAEIDVLAVGEVKAQGNTERVLVDVEPIPHTQSEAGRCQAVGVVVQFEGDGNLLGIALV